MQHRMKEFTMTEGAIQEFLNRSKVGRISTIGQDGYPYTVAVHYVYLDGRIYFHGLSAGEKNENIKANSKVCFEVDEYVRLMAEDLKTSCEADAEYESVVIRGEAAFVDDFDLKKRVFLSIIRKFAPELEGLPMPDARVKGTAVIEITPVIVTGKYHR